MGQEPTTPYSKPERFIHRTKKKRKRRNPFIAVENRIPKVNYPPFENLFEALVVYNPFLDLPFPMTNDQPMWGNNQAVAPTPGAAIITVDLVDNSPLKMSKEKQKRCETDVTVVEVLTHRRSVIEEKDQPRDENRNSQPREDAPSVPPTPEKKFDEVDFEKTMREFMVAQKSSNDFDKNQFFNHKTKVEQGQENYQAFIQDLETKFGRLSDQCSTRPTGSLPSNTQTNPKPSPTNDKPYRPPSARNEHVNAVFTRIGLTYDLPVSPNAKTTVIHDDSDDEVDEAEKEVESSSSKQTKSDPPPLKAYKPKIPYPQRLHKEKMENLPPKLGGLGSFLIPCTVAGSVEYLALADLGTSINLMPYSLYASLLGNTLKPTRMSIRLANYTYQYPIGIAENMLVQVGKFVFPADFVILQMEEDDKPFSTTSEKISDSSLDHEFEEFMAIKIEEIPEQEEEVKNSFEHLEYAFLEKDSLLPVVISALLQDDEKKRIVSVLKKHKEAFAWKTSDILGISPSFRKHKINFEDDDKPVI
ncbi:reverse transcriptase domain-containing protein [Tanacetum coccineum]